MVKNEILFIMDSVGWEEFREASTPNLDSLGEAVPAMSHGTFTVPSVWAMLHGALPTPLVPLERLQQSYHLSSSVQLPPGIPHEGSTCGYRPYDTYKPGHYYKPRVMNGHTRYLLSSNPHVGPDVVAVPMTGFDRSCYGWKTARAQEMVDWFVNNMKRPFFAVFLVTDTHHPYLGQDFQRETQLRAISYLDQQIKRLYQNVPEGTRIIVTSDHADIFRDGVSRGHDPRFIEGQSLDRLLKVFLLETIKETGH